MNLAATFTMNNKNYRTDNATLVLLRGLIPAARTNHDYSAVSLVMAFGLKSGRIVEVTEQ